MKSIDENNYDNILQLLDLMTRFNKSDLKKLRDILAHERDKSYSHFNELNHAYQTRLYQQQYFEPRVKKLGKLNKDKKELIGNLPFILMESKYFNTNQDIVNFAEKLNIQIPQNWGKRSKEEIIGRIIVNVSNLEKSKISQLNMILNQMLVKVETGIMKDDFFWEWDQTIKNMK